MITVQEGVQLAPLTTIRIGGAAQYFAKVESVEDIQQMIAFAAEKDVPYFVLGGGSNVLFADRGFPGVIIKIANSTLVADGTDVMCGAGATLMTLLTYAAENGLSGGERLAGIPGSIGGAVRGNAGAKFKILKARDRGLLIPPSILLFKRNLPKKHKKNRMAGVCRRGGCCKSAACSKNALATFKRERNMQIILSTWVTARRSKRCNCLR